MKTTTPQAICLYFYAILVAFWTFLLFSGTKTDFYNYLYSFFFGFIPFFGGIVAMVSSRVWGGLKSAVGKGVFFIGFGIFLWGSGEMVWSYYNFFMNEPAPYPSLADLGFGPSIFFYGLGAFYLSKAMGAQFGLRNTMAKFFAVIAPIVIFFFSYYILVVVARNGILVPEGETGLKTFLDILYPFGGFIGLTLSVVISGLSFKYLGGRYFLDNVSILAGLAVMFIADTVFSYTTTVGTYYNGNFGDLLLTTGLFLITFGVLGFYKLKEH